MVIYMDSKIPKKSKGMVNTKFSVFFFKQQKEWRKKIKRIKSLSCIADTEEIIIFLLYYLSFFVSMQYFLIIFWNNRIVFLLPYPDLFRNT